MSPEPEIHGTPVTYLYPWDLGKSLGLHAHEVHPLRWGPQMAAEMWSPEGLHPPKQMPEPAVCLEHPGWAPRNHPPLRPRVNLVRWGRRLCPGGSWGVRGRTGRNARTAMPGTVGCLGIGAAGTRGHLVPMHPAGPGQSAAAGWPRRLACHTAGAHKCQ